VRGSVPGPNGGLVLVRNAVKGPAVAPPDLGGDGASRSKSTPKPEVQKTDTVEQTDGASVSEAGTPPSSERPIGEAAE
jgi:hypothetical protein